MQVEMDKRYKTRDGREVRIYATDGCGAYPVQGAIKESYGWEPSTWSIDGTFRLTTPNHANNLIEVKPRIVRERWVSVYPEDMRGGTEGELYPTRAMADDNCDHRRIACVKVVIDCEHGEGL